MKSILLILFISSLTISEAYPWGTIGHRVVGEIAQQRLSTQAKTKLKLIAPQESLSDLANWPDWIKSDDAWKMAYPWHYVSIPDGKTYEESEKNPEGDVIEAIGRFARQLGDKKLPPQKRKEALAFLVHLVGDIHQPLHVGRAEDRGGNTIKLTWFGAETNLHEIWDEKIIEMEKMSYSDYVKFIDKKNTSQEKLWAKAQLSDWVAEAIALRPLVYDSLPKVESGSLPRYWEYKYCYQVVRTLNERLMMAGVRLAALLEKHL